MSMNLEIVSVGAMLVRILGGCLVPLRSAELLLALVMRLTRSALRSSSTAMVPWLLAVALELMEWRLIFQGCGTVQV